MWRRVRAALIALALVVGALDGLPLPRPDRITHWPAPLQRALDFVARAQSALLAPFRPLGDALFLVQRWSLFSGATADRYRLQIEGRRSASASFELLYRADDPRHRMLADVIEYRRVRGAYNPRTGEPPTGYAAFAGYIARRLFEARADLASVRVSLEPIKLRTRGRGYSASKTRVFELTSERNEVLP